MHIIKLDATNSTNTFLRQLSHTNKLDDYTVVVTNSQTQGRGQMGTVWENIPGKNLMFSVFKEVSFVAIDDHFYISIVVSLAINKALNTFSIPKTFIKWPNDILSDNKKICGVLIENVIKQGAIKETIIGIGLNVNQTSFDNLPRASSLKQITGLHYDKELVMLEIIKNLKDYFELLKQKNYNVLKTAYEANLFRKNKPSTFKNAEGSMFLGFIKGVSNSGKLQVLLEDNVVKEFNLKELELLY
ncbi:biotin--[acetyl-CoA-carboxylase] ligase [Corallibacter sp.]|uniref:biotin--[acetyl-CoA-carboxylase] ligase n=1 Tax=Corallibacter sp. TaxID=2038084 RepID=UPI003AB91412